MSDKPISVKQIKEILAQRNFAPRKSLGQNFLIDRNILNKIVAAGAVDATDLVLEIGPGLGALTDILVAKSGQVIAVEYDRGLFSILEERFRDAKNIKLLNDDVLNVDLKQLVDSVSSNTSHYKVVANLPYYITTPIMFQAIESGVPWSELVFLVQKELGQRVCAKPGGKDYGALTVMLNYYGQVEMVGNVPRTVFYPAPQVDSVIVRITPRSGINKEFTPWLHRVVQAAFGQRRKTIANALNAGKLLADKTDVQQILSEVGISPERRGETLTGDEFVRVAEAIRVRGTVS